MAMDLEKAYSFLLIIKLIVFLSLVRSNYIKINQLGHYKLHNGKSKRKLGNRNELL